MMIYGYKYFNFRLGNVNRVEYIRPQLFNLAKEKKMQTVWEILESFIHVNIVHILGNSEIRRKKSFDWGKRIRSIVKYVDYIVRHNESKTKCITVRGVNYSNYSSTLFKKITKKSENHKSHRRSETPRKIYEGVQKFMAY